MEYYIIFLIIILLLLYYLYDLYDRAYFVVENYENKYNSNIEYKDIYDKEFVNFHDIIYKDDKYEEEIVKYIEKELNIEEPKILVVGSGKGTLLEKIKKKYRNTHGLDKSENMLKKCHENHPYIKTIKANIEYPDLFEEESYDLILFDDHTLNYSNKKGINKICKNIKKYLTTKGILFVPIFEEKYLQPRPRYYTTNYIDKQKNIHGYTYINNFAHDCYYIKKKEEDGYNFDYYDKIILKDGKSRIKKVPMYIPEKEEKYEIFLQNGYKVKKIHQLDDFSNIYYEVCIFTKGPLTVDVEKIDKEINK